MKTIKNRSGEDMQNSADYWNSINWQRAYADIRIETIKLIKVFKEGDMAKVASIQHKIFNMHATHAVAVKDTLSKSGSKTPGVDGVVWKTQKDKGEAVLQVRNIMYNLSKYEPKPVKRVWIPKDNGDVRPLGIPCMIDRAVQRVYIYGIDPISEIVSDQDSYGFRLGRSAGDAILSVRGKLIHPKSSEWVMEADIKNCFDQFDHDYLLKVCPLYRKVDRKVMDKWLKVCIIDKGKTYWPKTGTPQGGTISPVLCNLALNGLESTIKESIRTFRGKWQRNIKVHIVRYADDFIVVGQTREELESIIKPINKFLNERGLRLNLNKTRIRHISQGFNFLGFKIAKRRYKHWKRSDMKKHTSDDRIVVLPQPQKLKNFRLTYKNTIKKMYKGNITRLIITLNPLLRGWSNYYSVTGTSANVIRKEQHYLITTLLRWLCKKHPTRGVRWVKSCYFKTGYRKVRGRTIRREWTLTGKELSGGNKTILLYDLSTVKAPGLRRLTTSYNPYMPDGELYFKERQNKIPSPLTESKRNAWRKQSGKCIMCDKWMDMKDLLDLHHNPPKHKVPYGESWSGILELVHKECHQKYHINNK